MNQGFSTYMKPLSNVTLRKPQTEWEVFSSGRNQSVYLSIYKPFPDEVLREI
jgi:hypothetical protein